jgi:hypothetical protein
MREFTCKACGEEIAVAYVNSNARPTDKEAASILFAHAEEHAPDCEPDTAAVLAEFEEVTRAV